MKSATVALLALLLGACTATEARIAWEPWSDDVFGRAAREQRFVLLDLEAVWCHWCHVMDEVTYHDPEVVALIRSRYLPVRVDQDARPDISRRYEDYGWPATVVFNADGGEIVKRRGYLPPKIMASMLSAIIDDPSPVRYGDSEAVTGFATEPLLPDARREALEQGFVNTHDAERGGLRGNHKYIDRDTIEYGLLRAGRGDAPAAAMTRQTLTAALGLIDPAWGGVYQYSTDSDWEHLHFEKIMSMQAEPLRLYALAYRQFGDARYLEAVRAIHGYVSTFLRGPEGAFYTSQDADLVPGEHSGEYFALDDAGRRRLGTPRVDQHRYARENGWMINALATAYTMTGEQRYLDDAQSAARWVLAHRALPDGGFRHDEVDRGDPFLEDTLAMGQAFLALYTATAEREWLAHARAAAAFVERTFRRAEPGYSTGAAQARSKLEPHASVDENVSVARFANLLHRHTGVALYREMSAWAMRFLVTDQVAGARLTAPGILLAAFESANEPLHITVVGGKDDPAARALFRAAIECAEIYRCIEWWDPREGPLPNPAVAYPSGARAAAYLCTGGACSAPIHEPAEIALAAGR